MPNGAGPRLNLHGLSAGGRRARFRARVVGDLGIRHRAVPLERAFAALLIANSDCVVHLGEENLAISDFPGARGRYDCLHCLLDEIVCQDQLQLEFGNQIDGIFSAAVDLGVSLLPAMSAGFEDGHAFDANLVKGVLHGIQLRCLDHRFELGHSSLESALVSTVLVVVRCKAAAHYTRAARWGAAGIAGRHRAEALALLLRPK